MSAVEVASPATRAALLNIKGPLDSLSIMKIVKYPLFFFAWIFNAFVEFVLYVEYEMFFL